MENEGSWSAFRGRIANGTASVLYGVIGIMTADLDYDPGAVPEYAAAGGALLVGLAMALTHAFVELVKSETQRGRHIRLGEVWELSKGSALVMIFPAIVAVAILVSQLMGFGSHWLAQILPYVSVITVVVLGFVASYALDKRLGLACVQALSWTLVSLLVLGAKRLGW